MRRIIFALTLFLSQQLLAGNPIVKEIYFESAEFELDKKHWHQLDSALHQTTLKQITAVSIQGYTDKEGSEIYNYRLSKLRANSVLDFLVMRGIDSSLIKTFYYGENIQPGKDAAQNRMVRLIIYFKEGNKPAPSARLLSFDDLPFDINGDSITDIKASYLLVGNERMSGWKCALTTPDMEGQSLIFHFHMLKKSYLAKGDTLKDIPKKRWGRRADIMIRYDSTKTWGPYRSDLVYQKEFYCGYKLTKGDQRFMGWIKFRVIPETGELIMADAAMKEDEFIVVGEH